MRLIDADALLLHLNDVWYSSFIWEATAQSETIKAIMDTIEAAPTIEPRRGRWEKYAEHWGGGIFNEGMECSLCGGDGGTDYDFCPHCGADMRGE